MVGGVSVGGDKEGRTLPEGGGSQVKFGEEEVLQKGLVKGRGRKDGPGTVGLDHVCGPVFQETEYTSTEEKDLT